MHRLAKSVTRVRFSYAAHNVARLIKMTRFTSEQIELILVSMDSPVGPAEQATRGSTPQVMQLWTSASVVHVDEPLDTV